MATTILLFLVACMTDREAYIAEYSTAVCAYREACEVGGDLGAPCEDFYRDTMAGSVCDEPDMGAVGACVDLLDFYATECPEDVNAATFAACESVCPLEE